VGDELGRAEAGEGGDAFGVEAMDEVREGFARAGSGDGVTVAEEGDFAEGAVEEMGGDVVHRPAGDDGGLGPGGGRELREERQEMRLHFAEEGCHASF
jgi:hypothetical protein